MLKRDITFENFNGETVTETHYFNLSKAEILKWEVNDGETTMSDRLKAIVVSENGKDLLEQFSDIILKSYGKKSEDGSRFIKTPESAIEFSQTAAYDTLFMELLNDSKLAANFTIGIMPKDMHEQIAAEMNKETPKTTVELAAAAAIAEAPSE